MANGILKFIQRLTEASGLSANETALYSKDDGNIYKKAYGGNEILIPAGGVWQDWTPTQTGWTALPTGVYRYCQVGKQITLAISMTAGTSNATSASLSLPITAATISGVAWRGANGYAVDGGSVITTATCWVVRNGATDIEFYTNMTNGAWTNSGSKRVYCVATYEAA